MCLTQNSSIYLNRIFFFFWHFDQLQHFLQFHQQVLERENKVEMEFLWAALAARSGTQDSNPAAGGAPGTE